MCLSLFFVVIKQWPEPTWKGKSLFLLRVYSSSLREAKAGTGVEAIGGVANRLALHALLSLCFINPGPAQG